MKMRNLIVDVDGVLCDLVSSAIPVINTQFNCDLKRPDIRMFEMDRIVGVKEDEFNKIFKQLDYSKMNVIDGAVQGLAELATRFHVVVATSRPTHLHHTTEKWLHENGFTFHTFMSLPGADASVKKKSDLYPIAKAIIDDDLREVIAASDFGGVACLFDAPWNHSINAERRFRRCHNWGEIVSVCMSD